MKYIWEIKNFERSLPSNVIYNMRWKCTYWENDDGTGVYVERRGRKELAYLDPTDPSFINYLDLTESKALEWIPNEVKENVELNLANRMTEMLSPPPPPSQAIGLPW